MQCVAVMSSMCKQVIPGRMDGGGMLRKEGENGGWEIREEGGEEGWVIGR